jgi:DMSO/TMAO reductase YedYZ molybdopterin-dependent catalytic subunit
VKTEAATRFDKLISTVVITLMCLALALTACANSGGEDIEWNLMLVGDEEIVLSYDEIKAMPSYEGYGGFFTTVGVVNGPFEAKGVPLEDICGLVGGITSSDVVRVSAPDGYSMVLSYEQIQGDFVTYDPETMKEVPHGELKVILMYEQDGKPLPETDGRPLRVAIVGADELLTEGLYWVKWVDKIETLSFE